MKSSASGNGRRWRRWLVRALIVLALLQGLYLVLANAFLQSSAGHRLINRKPEKIQISWGSARTFLPGYVHLTDVHLKNQNRRLRWELELDRARLRFSVPALALKRFSVRHLHMQGMEFRLLRRPEPGAPLPDDRPEISGFPGPLASPAGPRPPRRRGAWTLSLSGIEVEGIREVWIEDQRFVGDGRANGGVWLEVGGPLRIAPSVLELVEGRITSGDEMVSETVRLVIEARSDRFVPHENRGIAVLGFLSGRVRFESPETGFGFLNGYFRKAPWIDVGGTGDVRVDVTVDRGRLSPGSLVTVDSQDLTVDALEFHAFGRGEIRAEVKVPEEKPTPTDADGIETRLEAELHDFEIGGGSSGTPLARGSGLTLAARSDEADLVDGFGNVDVELVIPRSEIPDLSAFNAFLPAATDLRIDSGQGNFQGRLSLSSADHSGNGELEVQGEGVGLIFQDNTVFGDVRVVTRLQSADLIGRRFDISGTRVDLERFRITNAESDAEETGWWGKIELRDGELRGGEEPRGIDATLVAQLRDSGPLAAYLAEKKAALSWFENLMTVEDVTAEGHLRTDGKTISIDRVRITGDKLEILAAALHLTHGRRDGLFFFKLGPLSAAVEIDGQDRDWKLIRSRRWYEARAAELGIEVPD